MPEENNIIVKKKNVFQWWDYPIYFFLTAVILIAIVYFFSFWFSLEDWKNYPVYFSIMTLLILNALSIYLFLWFMLSQMRKPLHIQSKKGWKVGVATTFVPGAESIEMLEVTLNALTELDHPHDTWVLDEGDDDDVKKLCRRLGAKYFSRKNMPQYQARQGTFKSRSKHGNYNSWLHEIGYDQYDIVSFFDPDHVPVPEFLSRVLGFFEDKSIGYVQAPQIYYNQKASFIARGAAEETYNYYSGLQMACYKMGCPIITGCHNTHRVTALRQVGGLAPHDADDLLTTLYYRASGWEGVYVPEILAKGITPVDWSGYLAQQRRWARSVLDIKFRIFPGISRNLPLITRIISFLHGLTYIQESVFTLTGLILFASILATGDIPLLAHLFGTKPFIFLLILGSCGLYRQRFFFEWRNEAGFHWRAGLLRYAKWPYILQALFEALVNKQSPYSLTFKARSAPHKHTLIWRHLSIAVIIAIAWSTGYFYNHIVFVSLHIWTAIIIALSLILIVTEFLNYPDPYNKKLYKSCPQHSLSPDTS